MGKRTALIAPGALYLFWSIGVYYCSEISKNFKVVLVVSKEYKKDQRFNKACRYIGVDEIVYFEEKKNYFSNHSYFSNLFKELLTTHEPVVIAQHDYIGLENMYLFHWAGKLLSNCKKIVILSSRSSDKNVYKMFDQLYEQRISRYLGFGALNKGLRNIRTILALSKSFMSNILIPLLILKQLPYFPISSFQNVDIVPKKKLFDFFLVYEESTREFLTQLIGSNVQIEKVLFPFYDNEDINEHIYTLNKKDSVVFFPSLLTSHGSLNNTVNLWIAAIKNLRSLLPKYEFLIKLHPNYYNDEFSQKVVDLLKKNCPYLNLVKDTDITAEELVLNSEIIVGDTSTVIMWSHLIGKKKIISLDMKDFVVSSSFKNYKNIIYIENVEEILKIDFDALEQTSLDSYHHDVDQNKPIRKFLKKVTQN